MYGYAQPAVIAVDGEFLSSPGAVAGVAQALANQLRRRPVWVVVQAAASIIESDDSEMLLEGLFPTPRAVTGDPDVDTAAALAAHLEHLGAPLPVRTVPTQASPHVPASAIVAGDWRQAAAVARWSMAPMVIAWAHDARLVPPTLGDVSFVAGNPELPDPHALLGPP